MDRLSLPPLAPPPFTRRFVRIVFMLACTTGFAWSSPAGAADFACPGGDVQCLIDAITASNQNQEANTIHLAAGTYSLLTVNNFDSAGRPAAGLPVIVGNVAISGITADTTIIERANYRQQPTTNLFRIFNVALTGRLLLDRVTMRGGNQGSREASYAGGILSQGIVSITNSRLTENFATMAGVLGIASGTLTVQDSWLTRNSVGFGGDLVSIGNSLLPGATGIAKAAIVRTTISDNYVQEGAAIGVFALGAAAIDRVTIVRNGGIGAFGIVAIGTVTVSNSTVANNPLSPSIGVAIFARADSLVVNSTIVNNRTGVEGPMRIWNSIIVGHVGGNCLGAVTSLGHNLIGGEAGGCKGLLPSDIIIPFKPPFNSSEAALSAVLTDAGLGSLMDGGRPGEGHIPLLAGSPAIDAADPTACPATDQRQLARPIDGNADGVRSCDIGAVEFHPVVNDLLQLDGVTGHYVPPATDPNPLAAGGEFRVAATFTDSTGQGICHLAFEVVTLEAQSAPPLMLTATGDALGGEGIVIPAPLASGEPHLAAGAQRRCQFRIGVSAPEAITFFVNALGEPAITPCTP